MANADRKFDKTHLSIDIAEERVLIHRDYIAHCMRWSHVIKHLYGKKRYATAKIIDIGCGKETPMAKALYSNRMAGAEYCGVDLNKIEMAPMLQKAVDNGKMTVTLMPETSALDLHIGNIPYRPNVITNFETFEHMNPAAARKSLEVAHHILAQDGYMFFSTPCWNGKAAANHINETTYEAMGFVLQDIGFVIEDVFGTFASIADYESAAEADGLGWVLKRLRQYYDTNMLANVLAPLYPHLSRNALWVLKKEGTGKTFNEPTSKWSQHDEWEKMRGES
jgi:SAM-dependent methyltransferase